jgi:glutathione synthase/RimK-type ligase-like ATP-grasp enzyme
MIRFNYSKKLNEEYLNLLDKFPETKHSYTINLNKNEDPQEGNIINSIEAIKIANDKENLIRILRLNKFRTPRIIVPGQKTTFPIVARKYEHKNGTDIKLIDSLDECMTKEADYYQRYVNFKKEYIVHVCNLEIIKIEEKYSEHEKETDDIIIRTKAFGYMSREISIDDFSPLKQAQLTQIVTRALSITGLDMGYLNIGYADNDRFYVIDIDYDITKQDYDNFECYMDKLKEMIEVYENNLETKNDITIGCDPELLLKDKVNNTLIPASMLLKNDAKLGLDDRTIEASKQYYPILELRPDPSKDPIEVYQSIKEIIKELGEIVDYDNVGIYSGSTPITNYWLGGHIHFGMRPNSKLLRTFDNYLAIPIMYISNTTTLRQRYKFYGYLSHFRTKDYGGFEYCTLSSWLLNKDIIKGVLSLAKLISIEYPRLDKNYLRTYLDYKSYYSVKKDYFKDALVQIINDIKQTDSYQQYKEYIDYLIKMIENNDQWYEAQDIKEVFHITSSNAIYQLDNIIYIPKLKRQQFNLKVHDTISVLFGKQKYELTVLPLDDYTPDKKGYISFSNDIYQKFKISNKLNFDLLRINENTYKCGPIIGIHCDKDYHRLGPFGKQSLLFRRIIKLGLKKGVFVYVFSLDDIDYENNSVEAMSYDFETDNWYQSVFPLPDVVYDRGLNIVREIYGSKATNFQAYCKENQVRFINDVRAINIISNKLHTFELLRNDRHTFKYLPETKTFSERHLYEMINKHKLLYCKLVDGSLGSLIYCIQTEEDGTYTIIHRNKNDENIVQTTTYEDLYTKIKKMIDYDDQIENYYIVQQGLNFVKYKDYYPYELRILMVKNSKGIWTRVAMVGRVRTSNANFLGRVDREERSSSLLRKTLGSKEPIVRDQIYSLIDDVIKVLNKNNLQVGEFALDIGITNDLEVYIIELNSKPDTLLSYIGAYKLRNLYLNRIIEYGKYLTNK